MFHKKFISILIPCFIVYSFTIIFLTSCSTKKDDRITFLCSKPEIINQLKETISKFNEAYGTNKVELISTSNKETPIQKAKVLGASGNSPALMMLDSRDIHVLKNDLVNLSDEYWVNEVQNEMLSEAKIDGNVFAMPLTIESYGLIYNKSLLTKAGVDASKINTRNELEQAFKNVETMTTAKGIMITSDNWSLANHFLSLGYVTQSKNYVNIQNFIEKMLSGNYKLHNNKNFNGLLDTFEIMKKYNICKKDPIALGDYDKSAHFIAEKKVAFWFMGSWAWPDIKKFDPSGEYGFIPVPISNNENDYGNNEIAIGPSKFMCVCKKDNTEEQQKIAKDFLLWLANNEDAQQLLTENANVILPFKNIKYKKSDPLSRSMLSYMSKNKTLHFLGMVPDNHSSTVPGTKMQEFLAKKINKKTFCEGMDDYWKNVNWNYRN